MQKMRGRRQAAPESAQLTKMTSFRIVKGVLTVQQALESNLFMAPALILRDRR